MGLLTNVFKRRSSPASTPPVPAPDAVAMARARARRRLIGATVLLLAGLVAFPLLFETRPRPVAGDIAFEIARQDAAPQAQSAPPPLAPAPAVVSEPMPAVEADGPAPAATPPATAPRPSAAPEPAAPAPREIVEQDDGRDREMVATSTRAAHDEAAAQKAAADRIAADKALKAERAEKAAADKARADKERAEKAERAASASAQRIVVQVGAFTDPDKLREARRKVESLGLKTYTQVIEVDGVARTRVRVGPFATRAEADKAAARLKDAGLATALLQL
ncbi:MAG: hypothetical protein RIQ53_1839 [Pseudomonadota bacterium]|jgi:DedD protein